MLSQFKKRSIHEIGELQRGSQPSGGSPEIAAAAFQPSRASLKKSVFIRGNP